eukprot:m.37760 g.37760  ORF g.37760 m.37760 type:complete len:56 (+) comp6758_c0_seq1:1835-2002(+)
MISKLVLMTLLKLSGSCTHLHNGFPLHGGKDVYQHTILILEMKGQPKNYIISIQY